MKTSIVKEKSFQFALDITDLYKILVSKKEFIISKQLLRSSTSIGANIEEANAAQSKREFIAKMSISSKEAREAKYGLELLSQSDLVINIDFDKYLNLCDELIGLLTAIVKTAQKNLNS